MRGKGGSGGAAGAPLGITPAYAGKRPDGQKKLHHSRDHPRVCGEKLAFPGILAREMGSPPRMRGKVLAALMPENRVGITPAYAGKSC